MEKSIQMLNSMSTAMGGHPIDLEAMIEKAIWGNSPAEVLEHLKKTGRTLEQENNLILNKKSSLSKRLRECVGYLFEKSKDSEEDDQ
jgi:hypothetical protein